MSSPSVAEFETTFFRRLVSFGFEPKVIYDIGAAEGAWSRSAAEVFPAAEFHLFEPSVEQFPNYRAGMENLMCAHAGFGVHQIELGNQTRRQAMHLAPNGISSSPDPMYRTSTRRLEVPCWRLDEYAKAHGLPMPSIIKVDSKGAEAIILEGAGDLLNHADILFLETWLRRGYGPDTPLLTELSEALSHRAFVLVEIGNPCFADWRSLTSVDAFFLSDRLLNAIEEPSKGWRW